MLSDDIYQSRQKSWKWRNYKVHHRSTGKDNRHTHNQHALVNFRYVPTDLTNTGISYYTTVLRFMEFTVNQALFWVFYWIFAKPYESSFYKHENKHRQDQHTGMILDDQPQAKFQSKLNLSLASTCPMSVSIRLSRVYISSTPCTLRISWTCFFPKTLEREGFFYHIFLN